MRALPISVGRILLLLNCSIIMTGCASSGYRHPRLSQYRQTARTVAVVPFVFASSSADSTMPRRIAEVVRSGAYDALYESHRKGRLMTELQPLARTDSLLERAGVTASRIDRLSNTQLGSILGVDVVLRGSITAFFDPGDGDRAAAAFFFPNRGTSGEVMCAYELVDAHSDDLIWHFTEKTSAGLLRGGSRALDRVGRAMAARYPFQR
jgi:hypothetical protein